MDPDKADTIAKLLAKAERTTPGEAAILMAKASEMMIKYGIDKALLDSRRAAGTGPREQIIESKIYYTTNYRYEYMKAGYWCAEAMGPIKCLQTRNSYNMDLPGWPKADVLYVIGYESDVEQAKLLLASIQIQSVAAMAEWWRTGPLLPGYTQRQAFIERRSFLLAYGRSAALKLKALRDRIVESSEPGTDLALRDRSQDVQDFLDAMETKTVKPNKRIHGYVGNRDGHAAGKLANVGTEELRTPSSLTT